MTAPPDRASGDRADLLSALKMSEERWRDLGEVIREHGKYDNAGYCTATANRLRDVMARPENEFPWTEPYIVHACAAYPKLVTLMRAAVNSQAHSDIPRELASQITALLRELGELSDATAIRIGHDFEIAQKPDSKNPVAPREEKLREALKDLRSRFKWRTNPDDAGEHHISDRDLQGWIVVIDRALLKDSHE